MVFVLVIFCIRWCVVWNRFHVKLYLHSADDFRFFVSLTSFHTLQSGGLTLFFLLCTLAANISIESMMKRCIFNFHVNIWAHIYEQFYVLSIWSIWRFIFDGIGVFPIFTFSSLVVVFYLVFIFILLRPVGPHQTLAYALRAYYVTYSFLSWVILHLKSFLSSEFMNQGQSNALLAINFRNHEESYKYSSRHVLYCKGYE